MPSRKTTKAAAAAAARMPSIPKELVDQFVTGPMSAEAVQDISMAFKKALIERALGAELSHHLGYPPGAGKPEESANHRNGASGKTVLTEDGPVRIEVPRDREGSFEPLLIPKHERRFTGFDDKIVAMYARGTTVREILGFLAERYGTEVAPDYPIPCERMIQTRDQKVGDHAKARATLADIPFVHMRHGRPEPLI